MKSYLSNLSWKRSSCSTENSVTVFSSPFSMRSFSFSGCWSLGRVRVASGLSVLMLQSMACGLNGYTPHRLKPAQMTVGVMVLSHALCKSSEN